MPVRWYDIDLKSHVNNTRYLQWILDTLPAETLEKHLREVDVIYKAESVLGDTVLSETGIGETESILLHKLTSQSTGNELVQARTDWQ